ncbi:hypothetical protein [Kocuria sp.]|uniref:hypothetical protein n=1 Tax=Kocuria sp. TaxID=1871328 RepID=UPI0026DC17E8|nr:hypothetical protein [Kocuria sp.]MDO4919900.1 hypothetical protein [Kocuria sp.]
MHCLFAGVDRADTKNTIRDMFMENLAYLGVELSRAKASKLADQYKRGRLDEMDPELMRVLQYSDPTGETAVRHVMAAAA